MEPVLSRAVQGVTAACFICFGEIQTDELNFINTEFDEMLPETGEKQIEIFEMY